VLTSSAEEGGKAPVILGPEEQISNLRSTFARVKNHDRSIFRKVVRICRF